jgi:four helix bundle protein
MKSFKDLEVWKRGIDLVEDIYNITATFPTNEQFGLVSQMRRAAVSIPSNIAEGQGRRNAKEFDQFLYIAKGSLAEIETQLIICERLKLTSEINEMIDKMKVLRMMLLGLINTLTKVNIANNKTVKP